MQKSERRVLMNDDLDNKDWIGKVVDVNDPEFMGRCKVRVFGLFDSLPDAHIPWSFPAANNTFAGGTGGYAFISVPKVGTLVKIRFANGDRYSPEYSGIVNISPEVQNEISGSYEGSHVLVYDVDEDMKIFYTPSKGLRLALLQSNITINPDKSITIEHADSKSIIELNGTSISIVSQESVKVSCKKAVIDSPNIELGEGAVESLIKGDAFKLIWDTHTHPGPNLPPSAPLPSGVLSKTSKTK
jgi:hypothetical protein